MSPGTTVVESAVLSPDFLSHVLPVVHKAHEAFNPKGSRVDGEGGHLPPDKDEQVGDTLASSTQISWGTVL